MVIRIKNMLKCRDRHLRALKENGKTGRVVSECWNHIPYFYKYNAASLFLFHYLGGGGSVRKEGSKFVVERMQYSFRRSLRF